MQVIMGARKTGKKTDLIRYASAENLIIVCAKYEGTVRIKMQAENMGVRIPPPITMRQLLRNSTGNPANNYAFEEVFDCFFELLPFHIAKTRFKVATFNYEHGEV